MSNITSSLDKVTVTNEQNIQFTKDEIFLKHILKKFYYKIIETNDFNNFEKISSEWINYQLESNDRIPKRTLELMQKHKENKIWFSSLMGCFYQLGIGCGINMKKASEFYLLAINNEIKESLDKDFNKLH